MIFHNPLNLMEISNRFRNSANQTTARAGFGGVGKFNFFAPLQLIDCVFKRVFFKYCSFVLVLWFVTKIPSSNNQVTDLKRKNNLSYTQDGCNSLPLPRPPHARRDMADPRCHGRAPPSHRLLLCSLLADSPRQPVKWRLLPYEQRSVHQQCYRWPRGVPPSARVTPMLQVHCTLRKRRSSEELKALLNEQNGVVQLSMKCSLWLD